MDSKQITAILGRQLFESGHSPICANFQTMAMHECGIISANSGDNLCEYEIRVSASDFKADFKKVFKHEMLKNGPYVRISKKGEVTHLGCSYFTYVCPACLIREEQIPPYAGLIWIHPDGRIDHRIKAPQLHKYKATDALIKKIAHNLTQKALFGISHMTLVQRENKESVEAYKRDRRLVEFNMMMKLMVNDANSFAKRMLESKFKEAFEAAKKEFPEEYKNRNDWKEIKRSQVPASIPIPDTTPKIPVAKPVTPPKKEEPTTQIPASAPGKPGRKLVTKKKK